ncbi:MAG TPA: EAL domain-containing protein [Burkholderiaceae bacterium]|nr:EAL domain-containing protein [Burkholderiaceae bacterium]
MNLPPKPSDSWNDCAVCSTSESVLHSQRGGIPIFAITAWLWTGLVLFYVAILLPRQYFTPMFWLASVLGLATCVTWLAQGLRTGFQAKTPLWYALALTIALVSGLLHQSLPAEDIPVLHNNWPCMVTLLAASILASLAIAEHRRRLFVEASHGSPAATRGPRDVHGWLEASLDQVMVSHGFCLAYLDLNPLRVINDVYGYTTGDDIFRQVVQRIEPMLSDHHHLGRVGGEAIVIVFQHTPLDEARLIAQRILDDVRHTPCHIGPRRFRPQGFMGLVEITTPLRAQDALSVAVRACRMAGQSHPGTVGAYQHDAIEIDEHFQVLALLKNMGNGLLPERLFLDMQPILSLQDPAGSLNFEVLLRMRNTHGGDIPTTRLINIAEENGMMPFIDKWVFHTTLEWLQRHHRRLNHTQFVCINLSGMSLNDEAFIDDFFITLDNYQHLATLLCVEITEGVALSNKESTRHVIRRIQAQGVRVALDDFGAGYTSFSYLAELPANIIKIDGQFIRSMKDNAASVAIIQAIIALAHNLGMKSIAEWVEDVDTMETLRDLGVDYVQGNAITPPMRPGELLSIDDITSHIVDKDVRSTVLAGAKSGARHGTRALH